MSYIKRTVVDARVVDVQKRRKPTKHYVYVINVSWSEGSKFSIYRSYSMLLEFQAKLQDLFPSQVPSLPGRFVFGRGAVLAEKRKEGVSEFCKGLIRLPAEVSQNDDFLMFFEAWPEDATIQFDFDANLQSNAFYVSAGSTRKPAPVPGNPEIVGELTDEIEQYRAISTWQARSPREISFTSGDNIEVIEKNLNGWWVIVCGNREGVAPASYLEPVNHRPEEDKAEEDPYAGSYVVSIDFRARQVDEISLETNTSVDVVEKNLDGWWKIRANGNEGFFPSAFLKKMSMHRPIKGPKSRHNDPDTKAEEAVYGVLVNPPPRREEITSIDSIYSSIQSLQRDGKGRSSGKQYQYIEHRGASKDDGNDSDSDIFEYADFAPTGGGGGGASAHDDSPEYSEISSVAAAQRRRKVQEQMGQIHEKDESACPSTKPEYKPLRLIRSMATRRPPPEMSVETPPPPVDMKRELYTEDRTTSVESISSTTTSREDEADLYQVKSAYTSTEGDLVLQQGDIVEVDDIDDGWAYVRLRSRDKKKIAPADLVEGWAPANFLQICPKRKPKPNRPPPTLPQGGGGAGAAAAVTLPQTHQEDGGVYSSINRKMPRAESGPSIIHQNTASHPKIHTTQSLKEESDIIPINISEEASPGVYVNTRPYVNIPSSNTETAGDYAVAGSTRRSSAPVHPASDESHNYVNTGPVGPVDYVNVSTDKSSRGAAPSTGDDAADGEIGATYVALCDYHTMAHSCLNFNQGDAGVLLQMKGQGWWKIRSKGDVGWVPASYWEKELLLPGSSGFSTSHSLGNMASPTSSTSAAPPPPVQRHTGGSNRGRSSTNEKSSFLDLPTSSGRATPSGRSPSPIRRSPSSSSVNPQVLQQIQKNIGGQVWFHGKIPRKDAEDAMMRDGNNGDFVVRESANRVGDFALTVVFNGRVRHFPIEVTIDGKVLIGKHRFESMNKIIQHYKECPLFIQDNAHISLGQPFKKRK